MSDTFRGRPAQKVIVTVTDTLLSEDLALLRWQLRDLIREGVGLVVVDLGDLDSPSSPLLATLLNTHRACRRRGGGVVIRHAGEQTCHVLHRTGLDKVFEVEPAA